MLKTRQNQFSMEILGNKGVGNLIKNFLHLKFFPFLFKIPKGFLEHLFFDIKIHTCFQTYECKEVAEKEVKK